MARALRSFGGAHALLPWGRWHSGGGGAYGYVGASAPRYGGPGGARRAGCCACATFFASRSSPVAFRLSTSSFRDIMSPNGGPP